MIDFRLILNIALGIVAAPILAALIAGFVGLWLYIVVNVVTM